MRGGLKRRQLLAGVATGGLVIGRGCADSLELGDDGDNEDERWCGHDYRHLTPELEDRTVVYDGQMPGVSLEVPPEIEYSADLTVTVSNASDHELEIYADPRLAIQMLGDSGEWYARLGVERDHEWSERTTTLSSGDERSWVLPTSDFDSDLEHSDLEPYYFCLSPKPGRYRLLVWGVPDDSPGDPLAIAREFEIVEQEEEEYRMSITRRNETDSDATDSDGDATDE